MKTCTKCNIEKEEGCFKLSSEGYLSKKCKDCQHILRKDRESKDPLGHREKVRLQSRAAYYKHREKNLIRAKDIREKNQIRVKEYAKKYRELNKEKAKSAHLEYMTPERRKYYNEKKKENRAYYSEYAKLNYRKNAKKILQRKKERMASDPIYRLKSIIKVRICTHLSKMGFEKNKRTEEILGVSIGIAKKHIERQFKKGMGWHNHGQGNGMWHIDHKIPLNSAKTEQGVLELCHYTNLQPMWGRDNIIKSDTIAPTQMALII